MGHLKKPVAFLFLLSAMVSAVAQDAKVTLKRNVRFKHDANMVSIYDKAKNQTTIAMDWYTVYKGLLENERDNRVDIQAGFVFPGRVILSTPEEVGFGIKVGNRGRPPFKDGESPELTAIVDGQTISLGRASVLKSRTEVTTEDSRQISFAQLAANFTYAGFERITKAKRVAIKVGRLEFELTETNLEGLRDLASRVAP